MGSLGDLGQEVEGPAVHIKHLVAIAPGLEAHMNIATEPEHVAHIHDSTRALRVDVLLVGVELVRVHRAALITSAFVP